MARLAAIKRCVGRLDFQLALIHVLLIITLVFQGLSLRELNRMSAMVHDMSAQIDQIGK